MEFDIDISLLDLSKNSDNISISEILSVHHNSKARWREIEGYPKDLFYSIQTGYSNKKRILLIASRISGDRRQLLQVQVADEIQVDEYYCCF